MEERLKSSSTSESCKCRHMTLTASVRLKTQQKQSVRLSYFVRVFNNHKEHSLMKLESGYAVIILYHCDLQHYFDISMIKFHKLTLMSQILHHLR